MDQSAWITNADQVRPFLGAFDGFRLSDVHAWELTCARAAATGDVMFTMSCTYRAARGLLVLEIRFDGVTGIRAPGWGLCECSFVREDVGFCAAEEGDGSLCDFESGEVTFIGMPGPRGESLLGAPSGLRSAGARLLEKHLGPRRSDGDAVEVMTVGDEVASLAVHRVDGSIGVGLPPAIARVVLRDKGCPRELIFGGVTGVDLGGVGDPSASGLEIIDRRPEGWDRIAGSLVDRQGRTLLHFERVLAIH